MSTVTETTTDTSTERPDPAMAPAPGSLREFRDDVARVGAIVRQQPWLLGFELALVLMLTALDQLVLRAPDDPTTQMANFLGYLGWLLVIGWFGAQRVMMRDVMLGTAVSLGDLPKLIASQGRRFVRLAFLLLPAGAVLLAVMVSFTDDLLAEQPTVSVTGQVLIAVVMVVTSIALTLVTPALALENDRARTAWSIGWQRLRRHWRRVKWHAVVPALPIVFGPPVLEATSTWSAAVGVVAAMIVFAARGATVAAHLRLVDLERVSVPPAWPDGA